MTQADSQPSSMRADGNQTSPQIYTPYCHNQDPCVQMGCHTRLNSHMVSGQFWGYCCLLALTSVSLKRLHFGMVHFRMHISKIVELKSA